MRSKPWESLRKASTSQRSALVRNARHALLKCRFVGTLCWLVFKETPKRNHWFPSLRSTEGKKPLLPNTRLTKLMCKHCFEMALRKAHPLKWLHSLESYACNVGQHGTKQFEDCPVKKFGENAERGRMIGHAATSRSNVTKRGEGSQTWQCARGKCGAARYGDRDKQGSAQNRQDVRASWARSSLSIQGMLPSQRAEPRRRAHGKRATLAPWQSGPRLPQPPRAAGGC